MYNVLDIASYVINYCIDKDYDISNLKLQKILYYIQAVFLLHYNNEKVCFNADFEAWTFGPVIPKVYQEFKKFGGIQLQKIENFDTKIDDLDKKRIEDLLDSLSTISASALVTSTHNEDPWINSFNNPFKKTITKEAIYEYFNDKRS